MTAWSSLGPTVLASFLASMVEFVEALTIVLAVGLTRGWKSSLLGTVGGLAVLVALVVALGSSLPAVPLPLLQLVVGVLLLMFGLRWLQKAVLRSAGVIPLHDEALAFSRQAEMLRAPSASRPTLVDGVAFVTTLKAVVLEGLEVVFIVLALGTRGRLLAPAAAGALLALLLVVVLGLCLHRPLATVPENTLKFTVGVMLTSFGTYWAGEGLGLAWPWQDFSILLLIAAYLAIAMELVQVCRRLAARPSARTELPSSRPPKRPPLLALVAGELFGLFVDDVWLALGIAGWLAMGALLLAKLSWTVAACSLFTAGLAGVLALSAVRRTVAKRGTSEAPVDHTELG
jgi:uncharacterized membrane protein